MNVVWEEREAIHNNYPYMLNVKQVIIVKVCVSVCRRLRHPTCLRPVVQACIDIQCVVVTDGNDRYRHQTLRLFSFVCVRYCYLNFNFQTIFLDKTRVKVWLCLFLATCFRWRHDSESWSWRIHYTSGAGPILKFAGGLQIAEIKRRS